MNYKDSLEFICEKIPDAMHGEGAADSRVNSLKEAKMATAIAIAMQNGNFRKGDNTLYMYDGLKYQKLDTQSIKSLICEILVNIKVGVVYQVNSVDKIFKRILNDMHIQEFKPSKTVISFRNRVLDLKTMKIHPHEQRWMTRIFLDIDYDPLAGCPLWKKTLADIICNEDLVKVLQEFLGLTFVDRDELNVEACLFLYGSGANGKSVVETTIRNLLGENCSSHEISQLCTSSDSDYYTAIADGKLLNFAPDMGDKDFSGGRFKAIVSHQPIMVRPIGMAPFEAKDMPLLAACVNKMPITTDSSNGYWRRNKIIEFTKTFKEADQDKMLKSKLKAEMSGIFNWIMEGRARIIKQKGQFTNSEKMEEVIKRVRVESSSVLSFLKEKGYTGFLTENQRGVEVKMHSVTLMEEYLEYCKTWRNSPKSRSNLKFDLLQVGFQYREKMRVDYKVSNGFVFYKIEEEEEGTFGDEDVQGKEDKEFDGELPF